MTVYMQTYMHKYRSVPVTPVQEQLFVNFIENRKMQLQVHVQSTNNIVHRASSCTHNNSTTSACKACGKGMGTISQLWTVVIMGGRITHRHLFRLCVREVGSGQQARQGSDGATYHNGN